MRGRALLVAGALVVAAAVAASVVVAVVPGRSARVAPPPRGIGARATLDRSVLFGDTAHGTVDVLLDRRVVVPSSVRLDGSYGLWSLASLSTERRTDTGPVTHFRFGVSLVCPTINCLPGSPARSGPRVFQFPELRIRFRRVDGHAAELGVQWPSLEEGSRMTPAELRLLTPIDQPPFHAELAPPSATYRISPSLLVALLAAAAAALLAAAGMLVLRFAPRPRAVEAVAEPEPQREVVVELTPLERALLLLERARERGGVPEQRKALEHLAGELRRAGSPQLAGSATVLAWAERPPAPEETRALAAAVERSLHAGENGDGHA